MNKTLNHKGSFMKKLLSGLLILSSFSVFAQSKSEYQLGFEEGKQFCQQDLLLCSIKYRDTDGKDEEESVEAISRAEAIKTLINICKAYSEKYSAPCLKEIREAKTVCRKL